MEKVEIIRINQQERVISIEWKFKGKHETTNLYLNSNGLLSIDGATKEFGKEFVKELMSAISEEIVEYSFTKKYKSSKPKDDKDDKAMPNSEYAKILNTIHKEDMYLNFMKKTNKPKGSKASSNIQVWRDTD